MGLGRSEAKKGLGLNLEIAVVGKDWGELELELERAWAGKILGEFRVAVGDGEGWGWN